MGEEALMKSWRENPKDGLITVEVRKVSAEVESSNQLTPQTLSPQCSPYHYKNKVLLIGDSAHAMVPFYGEFA